MLAVDTREVRVVTRGRARRGARRLVLASLLVRKRQLPRQGAFHEIHGAFPFRAVDVGAPPPADTISRAGSDDRRDVLHVRPRGGPARDPRPRRRARRDAGHRRRRVRAPRARHRVRHLCRVPGFGVRAVPGVHRARRRPPVHVRHLRAREAVRRGHVRLERHAARQGGVPRGGSREGPPSPGRRAPSVPRRVRGSAGRKLGGERREASRRRSSVSRGRAERRGRRRPRARRRAQVASSVGNGRRASVSGRADRAHRRRRRVRRDASRRRRLRLRRSETFGEGDEKRIRRHGASRRSKRGEARARWRSVRSRVARESRLFPERRAFR